ncbi:SpnB-like Rossmann fold domain-containing protein [Mycobacterium riyadhense]|uniref:SpnB-like Rossmann fold domain-containing protein n=1 Tax=Mycobacterium riyadhense TaxID=486698 RepID=UPI0030B88D81
MGWVHHVSGVLVAGVDGGELEEWSLSWPPAGAVAVAGSLYDQPGGVGGFHYGPAFQAVRAVWRRDQELFVEVGLDADLIGEAAGFGLHPALLNAAWHVAPDLWGDQSASGGLPVSFAWGGVSLHARGVSALRVAMGSTDGGALWLRAVDEFGAPVVSVESLQFRRVDAVALGRVGARRLDWLHRVDWVGVPSPRGGTVSRVAILDRGGPVQWGGVWEGVQCYSDVGGLIAVVGAGGSAPEVVLTAVPIAAAGVGGVRGGLYDTLELIQAWLGEPVLVGSRLVVVTQAAVAAAQGEAPDLAGAVVDGLLRSAASEHPGRFMLLDVDGSAASWAAVPAAVAQRGESRLAVRDGVVLAPRLVQVSEQVGDPVAGSVFDPAAAVLITGGYWGVGDGAGPAFGGPVWGGACGVGESGWCGGGRG